MYDHDLDDQIIDRVVRAHASDRPITVARGMFFDRELKRELSIPGQHQSVICTNVKTLVEAGLLEYQPTGFFRTVFMGERTKQYPELRLLPA